MIYLSQLFNVMSYSMRNKNYLFEITNGTVDFVAQIDEPVGHLAATNQLTSTPALLRGKQ